ncbi:MAG: NAD(+)/NADH kinase [Planctomycetes bacterium]|nr:NAD(+)/NADH kinase [Planctomycetota bacterium]
MATPTPGSRDYDAPNWGGSGSGRPRALLLGSGERPRVLAESHRLRPLIENHADLVLCDFSFDQDLEHVAADFAVVLGGDGSIMRAARQLGTNQIPVFGVNLGKLGFLAAHLPSDFERDFPEVCAGRCRIVDHLMLQASVLRDGVVVHAERGLNELAILGGPPFAMLDIDLYVDSNLATTYSCDGLIISTPVGSTAHNLSVGGPILRNSLQAFVISPISPHTLTVRPVVDRADRVYELVVREPRASTSAVVDGRVLCVVGADDRVRVQRADCQFRMIETGAQNYYQTLRDKLGWRGCIRQ